MFNTFTKCCSIVAMFALFLYSAPAAFGQCDANEVTLSLTFDSWPEEAGWSITDADGVEVAYAAAGDYATVPDGGSVDATACLADGCYTLAVTDSYGDGGTSWSMTNAMGDVVSSGTGSGSVSTGSFCVGDAATPGCMDMDAINYNPDAGEDDGSCEFPSCDWAGNFCYDSSQNFVSYGYAVAPAGQSIFLLINSGQIEDYWDQIYVYDGLDLATANILWSTGFTSVAGNQDISGTFIESPTGVVNIVMDSDGSGSCAASGYTPIDWVAACAFPGCVDSAASNYNPIATEDDGSCEYVGCTDATACNFDPAATTDDASCAFEAVTVIINPDNYASETSWDLVDAEGNMIASGGGVGAELCVNETCYTFTMYDSFGDGMCCSYGNGSYAVEDANGTTLASGASFGSSEATDFCLPAFPGCTDATACNYDDTANLDDGTCDYGCIGCMDTSAANYDPTATQQNDGSCVYCDAGTYVMNVDMYDLGGDGWNGASYYVDSYDGETSISGNWDEADLYVDGVATDFHCIPLGCYVLSSGGGTADNEIAMIITDQFGTVYGDQIASNYYGVLPPPVGFPSGGWFIDFGLLGGCDFEGCTDENCFNYNISVTVDDGSCICPPTNNSIADAEAVFCGALSNGNLANASDEEGVTGLFLGTTITTGGVWYEFNSDSDQQVFANTCDTPTSTSGFADPVSDTKLHVFQYNDEGELELIVGNDDACGLMSSVAFIATTGQDYYIYVSKYSAFSSGSEFLLSVECAACDEIPSNDFCAEATPQIDNVTFTGTNCCASPTAIPSFGGTNYAVWFTFNSTDAVSGEDFDTFYFNATNLTSGDLTLTIYLAGGDCDALTTYVGCNFTGTCAGSIESFITLEPNTDYYFAVGTTDAETCGEFEFTTQGIFLGCTDAAADNYDALANQDDGTCMYTEVPENDLCADAADLPCGEVVTGSMGGATNTGFPEVVCAPCAADENAAYIIVGGGTWDSEITWSLTDADGTVFEGAATTGQWACGMAEGDFTFDGVDSYGDGWNGATATIYFNSNEVLAGFTVAGTGGSTTGTAAEDGTSELTFPAYEGVWYTFAGTGELHSINTCGSVIDTRLHVYSSATADCGDFSCVNQVDGSVAISDGSFDTCGFFDQDDAAVQFVSDPAMTYYVYVGYDLDGIYDGGGSFQIEMECEEAIYGCFVDVACNYNPEANIDADDCEYTSCACDANPNGIALIIWMADSFGDGWTGGNSGSTGGYEVFDADGNSITAGAIDDAMFIIDEDNFDGAEFGLDVLCLDPGCYSYDFTGAFLWSEEQSWYVSDGTNTLAEGGAGGSLVTESYPFGLGDVTCGCMEEVACNYDPEATDENGTCEYETCAGCTDVTACDFDPEATIEDGSCCYGSCITITMNDSFGDGWSGCDVHITDLEGNTVIQTSLTAGSYAQETYCLADGCYILTSGDDVFNNEPSWSITGVFGGVITGGELYGPAYVSAGGQNCIEGCDIACACNYDDTANILDLADCIFDDCAGCTYADASNYDANAGNDDGSCEFDLSNPCPADLNEDGSVTTADLLQFLGAFGTICE